jgi:hypothetical protein
VTNIYAIPILSYSIGSTKQSNTELEEFARVIHVSLSSTRNNVPQNMLIYHQNKVELAMCMYCISKIPIKTILGSTFTIKVNKTQCLNFSAKLALRPYTIATRPYSL